MSKSILIFVPGILTFPGDSRNWIGRAVTWTMTRSPNCRAEKVEYFSDVVFRAFGQQKRAAKLYATLNQYREDWQITLVGHSNGCAVITDMLEDYGALVPDIHALHLACGVCEASFTANGLNERLKNKTVGKVVVYVAGKDLALRLAHTAVGHFLRYGTLGLHGPIYVQPIVRQQVQTVEWPSYGHSDCWSDSELDCTLTNFLP